jgi:phosphatidylserine/phosphatidylglycerophosphate/cardiolipin synthase-like enzyme
VPVRVLTRPGSRDAQANVSMAALNALTSAGVRCEARPRLHQKCVFVDGAIAYVGSLNVLSFDGGTQEVMVRVADPRWVRSLLRLFE